MKNIIIVESPSKSKTIESYMGDDYKVLSSVGHIRDLATSGVDGLGIDIKNGFAPTYKIISGKENIVKELKKECKNKKVFLATDPDREGEAISYHLASILDLDLNDINRIEFHEITKPAILEAFKHPRKIDMDLVSSQETRRMLDRIIGFKVSKLLQSKIKSKSAGRVQSVALKLICDLEKEINNFISTPYYELEAFFDNFKLDMESYKGSKKTIESKDLAEEILHSLTKQFKVSDIENKESKRESKPPYTTSTLQQDASNKLNFVSTRTMRVAQSLYEGKRIGNIEVGLITYMRTDSTHLSDIFVKEAKEYISYKYGNNYVGKIKEKEQKLAQQAHEAIRPTSIERTPESVKQYLTTDEYKLYKLIYNRAITSLMAAAVFSKTKVLFKNNETIWKITGQTLVFDGYIRAYGKEDDDENKVLPKFEIGESYSANEIKLNELFTKPKSRYTEASLIKDMEELGIGRPSTYAQTMSTLKERKYIDLEEKKIIPTPQGILTSDSLDEFFSSIINVKYTADLEIKLDKISRGEADNKEELQEFYDDFLPVFENAKQNMSAIAPEETGEMCPQCGNPLVIRKGKYGDFVACSNYPKCKYVKQEENEDDSVEIDITCPKCGEGHFIKKQAKKGKNAGNYFYACSNYPKCKNIYNDEPTNEKCEKCGSMMLRNKDNELFCSANCSVEKENDYQDVLCPLCGKGHLVRKQAKKGKNIGNYFFACDNFPRCKNIYSDEPTNEKCEVCGSIMLKKDGELICSNEKCKKS